MGQTTSARGSDSWPSLDSPRAVLRRGPGIRRRLVLTISVLVAIVLLTQAFFLLLLGHRYLRTRVEQGGLAFATLSVTPVCEAYLRFHDSGTTKFRELLSQTTSLSGDLEGLAIYDMEGKVLFGYDRQSGREGADVRVGPGLDSRLLEAIRGLRQRSWVVEVGDSLQAGPEDPMGVADRRRLVVVQPFLENWGRHGLTVVYWFGYESVRGAALQLGLGLLLLGVLALAIGTVFAWFVATQTLQPVETLVHGAKELASGNLDHRVGLASGDELEVLGAALDRMAGLLSETFRHLESTNTDLERANRELQELDQVKNDLLANVSHELRTPLTAISGYVEALAAGLLGDVTPVQKDSLVVVERNIGRLRSMIDQLLGYARMDSGSLRIDPRPFDLEGAARQAMELVTSARGDDVELRLECSEDLPEAFGDAHRITQVLENLLTNAVKFSPSGATVQLSLRELPEGIEVRVSDRGIGIPDEHVDRIFERFYQIDGSSRRQYGGMGLGLAIVREILDQHHAPIRVDSRRGQGSTFRFVLAASVERTGYVPVRGGRRLLVIDDDVEFVEALGDHLIEQGWTVQISTSIEQGSNLIRRMRPDALLLERLLPDGDGFDLVARLVENRETEDSSDGWAPRDMPVVLCTSRPERGLGLRQGADDYWRKPISPAEVEIRLERLLAERSDSMSYLSGRTSRDSVRPTRT